MIDLAPLIAKTCGKHFITLSCLQYPPNGAPKEIWVLSGFVVDVLGEWFFITAGHIISDIRTALAQGSVFDRWRLDDQTAGNAFNGKAVPYDFNANNWLILQDDTCGLDYAATHISGLFRLQLEAGGAKAIEGYAWGDHFETSDHWAVAGVPKESVSYDEKTTARARFVVCKLILTEAPLMAGSKSANQFYARLNDGSEEVVRNANGLSGSPVFALRQKDGVWTYKVIGVQSAWYPSSRTLAICPYLLFAAELESVVSDAFAELARQGDDADNAGD